MIANSTSLNERRRRCTIAAHVSVESASKGRAALQQTEEQKVEAMSLCMSEPNQVLGEEPEVEVDADSDGEEEEEVEGVDCEGPPEED